jgi:glycosyltransferase involved in cell wall biosynthesis
MAGLANGVPVVTNLGPLSEPVWAGGAVAAAPEPDPSAVAALAADLANDPKARAELGRRGANLYRETFALEQTIARLRGAP